MGQARETKRREAVEAYYDCALAILAESGYGALKQAAVCERLGITTGAFYHNFSSWAEFTSGLLAYWREEQSARLIALVDAEPDPLLRLKMLLDIAASLPHSAEGAIRVWSTIDPMVAEAQAWVDAARLEVVRETFEQLVPPEEAEHYARTAVYLVTGHELGGAQRRNETLVFGLQLLIEAATSPRS